MEFKVKTAHILSRFSSLSGYKISFRPGSYSTNNYYQKLVKSYTKGQFVKRYTIKP